MKPNHNATDVSNGRRQVENSLGLRGLRFSGISTGRNCDGYAQYQVSRKDLIAYTNYKPQRRKPSASAEASSSRSRSKSPSMIPLPPSPDIFGDDVERLHFDHFRHRTAPSSNAFVSSGFWSHIVFQVIFQEPTVRYSALALSAWHRQYETPDPAVLSFSLRQYEKALQHMHELLTCADQDRSYLTSILTALILFHCIQNCVGDFPAAEKSLFTSRDLAKSAPSSSISPEEIDLDLKFTIHRLDLHSSTCSDATAPYRHDPGFLSDAEPFPESFRCSLHAFGVLLYLMKDGLHISGMAQHHPGGDEPSTLRLEDIAIRRTSLINLLKQWNDRANALEERMNRSETMTMNMALARILCTIAITTLCKDVADSEMAFDLYQPQFVYIITTVEAILKAAAMPSPSSYSGTHPVLDKAPFSCELGIIAPLFQVGFKCRDPYIRRRAVELLLQSRRREGRWESIAAARVCQRIIEIEEEGLGVVQSCHDIPEHQRIASWVPEVNMSEQTVQATFYIPSALTEGRRWWKEFIAF
ncbi:MAG: hypothetical protein Q9162_004062 [Coniocarpon cinnabarinum]